MTRSHGNTVGTEYGRMGIRLLIRMRLRIDIRMRKNILVMQIQQCYCSYLNPDEDIVAPRNSLTYRQRRQIQRQLAYEEVQHSALANIPLMPHTANQLCVICYSLLKDVNLAGGNKIEQTECAHYFHLDCLSKWKALSGTCPVCRQSVS